MVKSADTPRGSWPLGWITEAFAGQDGRVCAVNVPVGKESVCQICKLCPLEAAN